MAESATVALAGFLRYTHTIGLSTMGGRGFSFPADTAIGNGGRLYTFKPRRPRTSGGPCHHVRPGQSLLRGIRFIW